MPQKGLKRKHQIIQTAKEMFLKNGYQSTHIGQICDTLDIARGTVYQYFANKREIIFSILDTIEEDLEDIFDNEVLISFLNEKHEKKEVLDFVANKCSLCVKSLLEEPIVIKLIFKEIAGIDKEVISYIIKFINKITKVLTNNLELMKSRGIFKKETDTHVLSVLLIGGVLLVVYQFDKMKKDLLNTETINSIVDIYLNGALQP